MSFAWFLVGTLFGAGGMYVAAKEKVWKPNPVIGPGVTADGRSYDERGIIRDRGKFEGEPRWVPEMWGAVLEGLADEELGDGTAVLLLTDEDRRQFPELAGEYAVSLRETDDGFVYSEVLTQREVSALAD